jgi:predicted transcriptional regulator
MTLGSYNPRVEVKMTTTEANAKTRMRDLLDQQPDDSSYDEILRELALHRMIERGLADADAGRTVSHEEMGRRIDSWAK